MRTAAISILCLSIIGCASQNSEIFFSDCREPRDAEYGVWACTQAINIGLLTPSQEAQALSDRGVSYVGLKRFDDAIENYDQALILNANDARTFYRRGVAYRWKAENEKAIEDFDRAVEIDPKLADAYFGRGLAYFELGKYDEALQDYDRVINIDPKYVLAYNSRGHTYFTRGEWELAIAEYKRAIEVDPNLAIAHQNLATAYVQTGEYGLAMSEYDRALELDPEHFTIHYQRAAAWAQAGNLESALKEVDIFIDSAEEVTELENGLDWSQTMFAAYFMRGGILFFRQDYSAAIESFGAAIDLNLKIAEPYFFRALAHQANGDESEANQDYKTALRLDPQVATKVKSWLSRKAGIDM